MAFLGYLGKLLISLGVGVLMFVGWTLKGTDIYTHREQRQLEAEFDRLPAFPLDAASGESDDSNLVPPKDFADRLQPGDPVFRLTIPRIDVSDIVVAGVDTEELKKGPGLYPECRGEFEPPLCTRFPATFPGEKGRAVVSGHRTTYGAPFWGLDKVRVGDDILIETQWGDFVYRVFETKIVDDEDATVVVEVLDHAELVLTTCNPRFSAAERLVVYAELEEADPV
ncbi:MAG TPA: sortase [Actinomycetota bacterium]|nr:sortase [Actinomycetota bacterium]